MKRCPPAGTRVCFHANPAARTLYSGQAPGQGECGTVESVPTGGGRATCMPGPLGGLVYVNWDRSRFEGVFRSHLTNEKTGKAMGRRARRRRRR